jgi:hypothetical protein
MGDGFVEHGRGAKRNGRRSGDWGQLVRGQGIKPCPGHRNVP